MLVVYKHSLTMGRTILRIHRGWKPVLFDFQYEKPQVWVENDTGELLTEVTFRIFSTGQGVPTDYHHVQSCLFGEQGETVWHLYQRR